jgi:hypothetical protein
VCGKPQVQEGDREAVVEGQDGFAAGSECGLPGSSASLVQLGFALGVVGHGQVIDPVRDGLAQLDVGKVVGVDPLRVARRAPFPPPLA